MFKDKCIKCERCNEGATSFAIFPVYRLVRILSDGFVRFVTFLPLTLSCYLIIDATSFTVDPVGTEGGGGGERSLPKEIGFCLRVPVILTPVWIAVGWGCRAHNKK